MTQTYRLYGFIFLCCALLLAGGCWTSEREPDRSVFARVGTDHLTLNEARQAVPAPLLKKDSIRTLLNYRSQWVRKKLLVQEAKRLNIDQKEEVQQKIKQLKEDLYVKALQDYVLSNRVEQTNTSREQARDYYQQHKDKFTLNERYIRFRHMVTASSKQADKAKSELLSGINWSEVAEKYHVNPRRALKRSEQFYPVSMAAPDVSQMQQFLEVIGIKEISPIRYVNGNYHFVQLMAERPAGHNPDLQWMLDNLQNWLVVKKKKEELNAYIKNLYLRAQANNEIEIRNVFDSDSTVNRPFNDTTQTSVHD